jgi:uncharacterized protein YecE (DUF72 family)
MASPGEIRIGISGWQYKPWRGVFYPKDLTQKRELEFASRAFPSLEINGTFYSLKRPENFERWATETPDDFVFAVKGPRYLTHMRRLRDIDAPLANFFASGIFRLGPKLGPILWQLPPNFTFDAARMEAFFKLLPRDTAEAAAIARRHDKWLKGRVDVRPKEKRRLRHALEIRHTSFVAKEFIDLLRAYDVALVCADTVEWPRLMDVTSDFIYCRLHGSKILYASGYKQKDIAMWARWVTAWLGGREPDPADPQVTRADKRPARKLAKRDVYVYFDNDAKARAPFDAHALIAEVSKLLGLGLDSRPALLIRSATQSAGPLSRRGGQESSKRSAR